MSLTSLEQYKDGTSLCTYILEQIQQAPVLSDNPELHWTSIIQVLEKGVEIAKQKRSEVLQVQLEARKSKQTHVTLQKIQCVAPKGKLDLLFGDEELLLVGPKDLAVSVMYENIQAIVKLPKNVSARSGRNVTV